MRLGTVDAVHAVNEGEGYQAVSDWPAGHEEFWRSPAFRAVMRNPTFTVSDSTEAVLVRFGVAGPALRDPSTGHMNGRASGCLRSAWEKLRSWGRYETDFWAESVPGGR